MAKTPEITRFTQDYETRKYFFAVFLRLDLRYLDKMWKCACRKRVVDDCETVHSVRQGFGCLLDDPPPPISGAFLRREVELGIRKLEEFTVSLEVGKAARFLAFASIVALGGGKKIPVRSREDTKPSHIGHAPAPVGVALGDAVTGLRVGKEEMHDARGNVVDLTKPNKDARLFVTPAEAALEERFVVEITAGGDCCPARRPVGVFHARRAFDEKRNNLLGFSGTTYGYFGGQGLV